MQPMDVGKNTNLRLWCLQKAKKWRVWSAPTGVGAVEK
jgi:hypothetical protein